MEAALEANAIPQALPWYRRRRDRSSAAPHADLRSVVGVRRLSLLARCPRRARVGRVARRTCIIRHTETPARAQTSATECGTASTQRFHTASKISAVPSRSRSLLRRPNCFTHSNDAGIGLAHALWPRSLGQRLRRHDTVALVLVEAASPRVGRQHLERQRVVPPAARDRLLLANQRLADAAAALALRDEDVEQQRPRRREKRTPDAPLATADTVRPARAPRPCTSQSPCRRRRAR